MKPIKTKCCGYLIKHPRKEKRKYCPDCGSPYPNGVPFLERCRRAWRAFNESPRHYQRTLVKDNKLVVPETTFECPTVSNVAEMPVCSNVAEMVITVADYKDLTDPRD